MQQGFTLLELLVVIAIIGILSATTLSSVSAARVQAQVTATAMDLRNIERALYAFNDTLRLGHWFYESICVGCFQFSTLAAGTDFDNYYKGNGQASWSGAVLYQYDHDSAASIFTCGSGEAGVSHGVNILIAGATAELYTRLEALFSDDGDPHCGKIRRRADGMIFYMISDNGSRF